MCFLVWFVVSWCTYIYWTALDFGQSTGPTVDCRMMDLLYHGFLVRRLHCYCSLVRDAIQRNVVSAYGHHYLTSIDHSIDRLFPNDLTWFAINSYLNTTENAALHSRICTSPCWFIVLIYLLVSLSLLHFYFHLKMKKNERKKRLEFEFVNTWYLKISRKDLHLLFQIVATKWPRKMTFIPGSWAALKPGTYTVNQYLFKSIFKLSVSMSGNEYWNSSFGIKCQLNFIIQLEFVRIENFWLCCTVNSYAVMLNAIYASNILCRKTESSDIAELN